MIRSHARFERCERRPFPDLVNPEDRAAAIAHEHSTFGIECDPGGDAKVSSELLSLLERGHAIHSSVVPAGNKHLTARTECESGRVNHLCQERLALAVWRDLED